jgi:hypothetical protein
MALPSNGANNERVLKSWRGAAPEWTYSAMTNLLPAFDTSLTTGVPAAPINVL